MVLLWCSLLVSLTPERVAVLLQFSLLLPLDCVGAKLGHSWSICPCANRNYLPALQARPLNCVFTLAKVELIGNGAVAEAVGAAATVLSWSSSLMDACQNSTDFYAKLLNDLLRMF